LKGEIVSPAELESILLTHDAVEDAAVVGIENEERGEVPKAFITLKKGKQVDERSLITFVNLNVNPIKKLRGGVKFLEEFPRSAQGIIKKNELKKIS
jgi:acyl-coenzyme A synthetase/AMP-(fatty) acid ligase